MGVLDFITNFLKGGKNAGRVESRVSGGHGPERRILHTVSAVCEQALSDFGGIRVLASACTDERGRDTGPLSSDPICRESRALRFIDPIVGFKSLLLPRLKGALASADGIPALVNDIYCV